MIPLLIFSVTALAISIDRWIALQRKRVIPTRPLNALREHVLAGEYDKAAGLANSQDSSITRIFRVALEKKSETQEELRRSLEMAGRACRAQLEAHIHTLQTIASASPLLGLLGTVIGMIKTFAVIQMQGIGNTEHLAGGISEALISTATGLTVAIPFFIVARYFTARIDRYTIQLEETADWLFQKLSHQKVD